MCQWGKSSWGTAFGSVACWENGGEKRAEAVLSRHGDKEMPRMVTPRMFEKMFGRDSYGDEIYHDTSVAVVDSNFIALAAVL
jgi:hypothetical protein